MKVGYSLLLGEHVQADEVEHGDCATFQITCPACREAVFKCRSDHGDRKRHWLSHYPASKSDIPDCELRVASTTREQIEQLNIQARGQQLRVFLSHFRDTVLDFECEGPEMRAHRLETVERMQARPVYRKMVLNLRNDMRARPDRQEDMWRRVEGIYADNSPFWRKRQLRFARDFIAHLVAPTSYANFSLTVSMAMIIELKRLLDSLEGFDQQADRDFALKLIGFLREIVWGSDRALRQCLADVLEDKSASLSFGGIVMGGTMSLLVALPYIDMLRKEQR